MVQMFVSISSLVLSIFGFLIGDVLVFFDKPPSFSLKTVETGGSSVVLAKVVAVEIGGSSVVQHQQLLFDFQVLQWGVGARGVATFGASAKTSASGPIMTT